MKTYKIAQSILNKKALLASIMSFMLVFGLTSVHAQRVSATFNLSSFQKSQADVDFNRSLNIGANLRVYTNSKFAIRAGLGIENLRYSVGAEDGLSTDLKSRRKDLKGNFGVEYHPTLGDWLDFYPGLYIPVTVTGDDIINDNINNLSGGNFSAGLGAVIGANIRFLKVFRVGVEVDAKYDSFKGATMDAVDQFSLKPYGRMNYSTSLTLGIMI